MAGTHIDIVADKAAMRLIDELKPDLGARTPAEVIRKALAIAREATRAGRGSDGVVVIRGKDGDPSTELSLSLRS